MKDEPTISAHPFSFKHASSLLLFHPLSFLLSPHLFMPEIRFQIQWPDGSQDICYSPSLVVKEYFAPATDYTLNDFVDRSRTALQIASDRVQAKYGMPCGRALSQLAHIEAAATRYTTLSQPIVRFIQFLE